MSAFSAGACARRDIYQSRGIGEAIAATFDINLRAPILLVQGLWQRLGSAYIISISSVSDRIPEEDLSIYCASKAANTRFFGTLAEELKSARVVSILPDYVDTPMLRGLSYVEGTFNWDETLQPKDVARRAECCAWGRVTSSGAAIIVTNNALLKNLEVAEEVHIWNADTQRLFLAE